MSDAEPVLEVNPLGPRLDTQLSKRRANSEGMIGAVHMTSRILNVSEGIAALNIKIAVGIAFCLVAIIATFLVNVMAFNYAKESETDTSTKFVLEKASGELQHFHPKFAEFSADLT
mmetsp:Transcript_17098/g.20590  ORF Transcript_17098/g.20590 Transcript_17098/m.20590 type:complete len:116 (-) Transcript_17098:10-357(-)